MLDKNELERCIDDLAREENLGRVKMIESMKHMGINIDSKLSFLKEGAGKSIIDAEVSGKLYDLLKLDNLKDVSEDNKPIDFLKFLPFCFAFFMETKIKEIIKHKYFLELIKGYPVKLTDEDSGKVEMCQEKGGTGLYKVFADLTGVRDLDDEVITYRDVDKALKIFRT